MPEIDRDKLAQTIAEAVLAAVPIDYAGLDAVPELPTVDLPDQQIFAVGKFNGIETTMQDLEEMVRADRELAGKWKSYLKIRHINGKTFQDVPFACGIVANLRIVGQKLIGDFKKVPAKVVQLIKAGAFNGKSAEIWHNIKTQAGKTYPRLLKGVALLGSEVPALWESIDDVIKLYAADEAPPAGLFVEIPQAIVYDLADGAAPIPPIETSNSDQAAPAAGMKENPMDEKQIEQLKAEKTDLERQVAEFKAKPPCTVAEHADMNGKQLACPDCGAKLVMNGAKLQKCALSPADERIVAYQTEQRKLADQLHGKDVALFIQQQEAPDVARIIPRFKADLELLLNSLTDEQQVTYSTKGSDGKPAEQSIGMYSLVKRFVEALPKMVEYRELAKSEKETSDAQDDTDRLPEASDESVALDREIKDYAAKHNLNYSKAYDAVTLQKRRAAASR